jgi:acetyl esterase/lipase
MKALLSFLAVALILAATATADWVVESRVEDPDGNVTSVNKVKADKIRYDMPKGPIGPVSTIFDAASGDWIIIMHGLKTFQKQSAAQMKRGMDAIWSGPDVKSADTPKYKATGEKGKVGDFDCEIYAATDQRLTFRVWVATSHPQAAVLKAIDKLNTRFLPSRALDYSTLPGVVLKTEMDLEGKKTTVTVVSVKEQDLDAREFEAPAGYQSMPDSGLPSASRGSAPATKPSPQAAANAGAATPGHPAAAGAPPPEGVTITLTPQTIAKRYGAGFPAGQMPANAQNYFWVVDRPDNETKVSPLHNNQWHFSGLPGLYKIQVQYRSGNVNKTVSNVLEVTVPGAAAPARRASSDSADSITEKSFSEARQGFVTKLLRQESSGDAIPIPPAGVFNLIKYDSPIGKMDAYVGADPKDGKKHPAIIWLVGGFSNSISDIAWTPGPSDNDQSATAFREAGMVMMYPSERGGNQNPGQKETFYGEVDDVRAALKYLKGLGYVDPTRIYLGGHSTGGTLALLVGAMTKDFRAIIAFGPANSVLGYGKDVLTFYTAQMSETWMRSPIIWNKDITSPTYVIEGSNQPSNIKSLQEMEKLNKNSQIHFAAIEGATHFSDLQPVTRYIASRMMADNARSTGLELTSIDLNAAFAKAKGK